MKVEKTGSWEAFYNIIETLAPKFKQAAEQALAKEAGYLQGLMVHNLDSEGGLAGKKFKPLAKTTLLIRARMGIGHNRILSVTRSMRNAIKVSRVPAGGFFIGIANGERSGAGKDLAKIGKIHEYGSTRTKKPYTDRQRKFLAWALQGTSSGGLKKTVIKIPARAFIGPVIERFAKPNDVQQRFWNHIKSSMGGLLGK